MKKTENTVEIEKKEMEKYVKVYKMSWTCKEDAMLLCSKFLYYFNWLSILIQTVPVNNTVKHKSVKKKTDLDGNIILMNVWRYIF